METAVPAFDAAKYKQTTFEQWQSAAGAWYRWSNAIRQWLGQSTDTMIEMAGIGEGHHVLDVAAGAGEQTITAAKAVGPTGYVLATDIAPNILMYARKMACEAGLYNIETAAMDGENLTLADETFDAVISRVGLIYFPDQQKALREMWRVLKPGGRIAAIVYSTPDKNAFFSIPVSIIRKRANLPPPVPGQPGAFSLGAPGVIENAYAQAGFKNPKVVAIHSPVQMASAKECVRFEKESFGALHQMMAKLSDDEKRSVWEEIENELSKFDHEKGFTGPCEMLVAVAEK
ncbi:MAG TPA: class I SAM-dependent methyltransferase [Chitinophagaceae bacterium]|nr:class I SAM-dependent methyltransferase [Chitinophagaceae bacterium]